MQIPIQIGIKGRSLLGMLHVPEKRAEGSPVILLCCGFDGKMGEVHRMAVLAARRAETMGISMLRFDCCGLGISEDEFWHTSISRKIEDTLAAVDFLRGCFQGEKFTLIPLGFSDGARIAAVLHKMRACISGMAFWNPVFYSIASGFASYKPSARIGRHPVTKEFVFPFNGLWIGREYLKEQTAIPNAINDFYGFEGPRLSIFGSADPDTRETCKELEVYSSEKGERCRVITVEGSNHTFNSSIWAEKAIAATLDWALKVGVMKMEC